MKLLIAYGASAIAMLIGLVSMRADTRAYFRWPVYSAMVMALGVVLWNLLRKHLVPQSWDLTHPNLILYGAIALYFTLGLGVGLFLGRLTQRQDGGARPGDRDNSDIEGE
jgi:hypothetical protein